MIRKKQKRNNSLYLLGIVFLLIAGFLGSASFRIYQNRVELNRKINSLKLELAELEQEHERIMGASFELEGDEYWEEVLREQLIFQKPGEEVVAIVADDKEEIQEELTKQRVWWNPFTW